MNRLMQRITLLGINFGMMGSLATAQETFRVGQG